MDTTTSLVGPLFEGEHKTGSQTRRARLTVGRPFILAKLLLAAVVPTWHWARRGGWCCGACECHIREAIRLSAIAKDQ